MIGVHRTILQTPIPAPGVHAEGRLRYSVRRLGNAWVSLYVPAATRRIFNEAGRDLRNAVRLPASSFQSSSVPHVPLSRKARDRRRMIFPTGVQSLRLREHNPRLGGSWFWRSASSSRRSHEVDMSVTTEWSIPHVMEDVFAKRLAAMAGNGSDFASIISQGGTGCPNPAV